MEDLISFTDLLVYFYICSDILEHVKKNNLQPAPVSKVKLPAPAAAPAQPTPSIPQSAPSAPMASASSQAGGQQKKIVEYHQIVDTEENVYDDKALTSMRKVIAKRLTESKVYIIYFIFQLEYC